MAIRATWARRLGARSHAVREGLMCRPTARASGSPWATWWRCCRDTRALLRPRARPERRPPALGRVGWRGRGGDSRVRAAAPSARHRRLALRAVGGTRTARPPDSDLRRHPDRRLVRAGPRRNADDGAFAMQADRNPSDAQRPTLLVTSCRTAAARPGTGSTGMMRRISALPGSSRGSGQPGDVAEAGGFGPGSRSTRRARR